MAPANVAVLPFRESNRSNVVSCRPGAPSQRQRVWIVARQPVTSSSS